ncbi:MAG: WYL domain-containing protein [Lachnospiraceae bacterium]|nr:WYL domain-containing protein [Lachnospiraceae bacterium]
MAYSEVVKNFNCIRDYMREFYVYGFKSRNEYTRKSGRSYDDERRRLESWLGDYMQFRQTQDGKNVFISIDSRISRHNPLYKAWKAKSFTDGDITLHFILMDIFASAEQALNINEITAEVDRYVSAFSEPRIFDVSTVRKKLKEYVTEGILVTEKQGKVLYYRTIEENTLPDADMLDYFSEIAPCGVIGSFLLDKQSKHKEMFAFKHHYITGAIDSEIVCLLFMAMSEKKTITMETINRRNDCVLEKAVVPLRIMDSVQSGRQYLMAYFPMYNRISSFRIDNIISVKINEESPQFDELREKLNGMLPYMWGISTQGRSGQRMEHVEFTVHYNDYEQHIHKRLERERRCGTVEKIDNNTSRFTADIFDASEMIPWIRTFICRITDIHFSDSELENQFRGDIEKMYQMYGLEGGERI